MSLTSFLSFVVLCQRHCICLSFVLMLLYQQSKYFSVILFRVGIATNFAHKLDKQKMKRSHSKNGSFSIKNNTSFIIICWVATPVLAWLKGNTFLQRIKLNGTSRRYCIVEGGGASRGSKRESTYQHPSKQL